MSSSVLNPELRPTIIGAADADQKRATGFRFLEGHACATEYAADLSPVQLTCAILAITGCSNPQIASRASLTRPQVDTALSIVSGRVGSPKRPALFPAMVQSGMMAIQNPGKKELFDVSYDEVQLLSDIGNGLTEPDFKRLRGMTSMHVAKRLMAIADRVYFTGRELFVAAGLLTGHLRVVDPSGAEQYTYRENKIGRLVIPAPSYTTVAQGEIDACATMSVSSAASQAEY